MTDYLILGGGSAGCVLAARLTETGANSVTLVEAGRDLSAATMPPSIASRYPGRAYLDPDNIWPTLTAKMGAPRGNTDDRTARRYEQGRVLGGGSAVNAMVANRGGPSDYDEWGDDGRAGLVVGRLPSLFPQARARRRFRRRLSRQGRPDPDPPDRRESPVALRQGGVPDVAIARLPGETRPERALGGRRLSRRGRGRRRRPTRADLARLSHARRAPAQEPCRS